MHFFLSLELPETHFWPWPWPRGCSWIFGLTFSLPAAWIGARVRSTDLSGPGPTSIGPANRFAYISPMIVLYTLLDCWIGEA